MSQYGLQAAPACRGRTHDCCARSVGANRGVNSIEPRGRPAVPGSLCRRVQGSEPSEWHKLSRRVSGREEDAGVNGVGSLARCTI